MVFKTKDIIAIRGIVSDGQGKFLAGRRASDSRRNAGLWEWVGGQPEWHESTDETLVREAREEAGIAIKPLGAAACAEYRRPLTDYVNGIHLTRFFAATALTHAIKLGPELDDGDWFSPQEIAQLDMTEASAAARRQLHLA